MSSKLRKLKQEAYEAGRKRDWAGAAAAYERILEQDKSNPALQNEYGDVCLKMGDTGKAIRQFLSAAAKYRQTGLLNNSQAVYKKVLRHDPSNLNANWFLAELRAAQGMTGDGAQHALTFLAASGEVSGELKEIFLKRCLELLALYPESDPVLERVEGVFRIWNLPLEGARAGLLRACAAHREGRVEEAAATVARITTAVPEVAAYMEHTRWREQTGERTPAAAPASDFNAIDLDGTAPAAEPVGHEPLPSADTADDRPKTPPADLVVDRNESLQSAAVAEDEVWTVQPAPEPGAMVERDDDGCISIDESGETSISELAEQAAASLARPAQPERPERRPPPTPGSDARPSGRGTVNLLDEILAEEGDDLLRSSESEQVATIASEIGRNLGESDTVAPETQYQQGLVYLELGMFEQAAVAFATAADDAAHALRAREMWGIALHRAGKDDAALAVLEEGLAAASADSRQALGLRYHAGRILEGLGRTDEAQEHYRQVHAGDAGFADVVQRLRLPVS